MDGWVWMCLGALFGAGVTGVLWWLEVWLMKKNIRRSASEGQSFEVDGAFYNAVPSALFVKMNFIYRRVQAGAARARALEIEAENRYAEEMGRRDRAARHTGTDDHDMTTRGGPLRGAP